MKKGEIIMKKIFSFDAETNGLWGQAFSIGCIITNENGQELKEFVTRCPIEGQVNEFVKENVLPEMEGIKVTHKDYESMLKDFMDFYMDNKQDTVILVHMGLPVESKLFLDAHELGFIGDWDAPYPLVDISAIPEIGTSPDTYNKNNGIVIPNLDGGTHNPLYDSWSALLAYQHWIMNR